MGKPVACLLLSSLDEEQKGYAPASPIARFATLGAGSTGGKSLTVEVYTFLDTFAPVQ